MGSRFYASIQGSRGEATRQGTPASGMYGHIRGWDIGCRVGMATNTHDRDMVSIDLTGGSNGHRQSICLGSYHLTHSGLIVRYLTNREQVLYALTHSEGPMPNIAVQTKGNRPFFYAVTVKTEDDPQGFEEPFITDTALI